MKSTVDVYGLRVNQARVMRSMTATAVMEALGWKHSRLNRLEKSATTALPVHDFEHLVEVLRFPSKFFTTAPASRVHQGDLLFRAPRSITATEREYLAQFAALTGDFLDELNARTQLPPVKLPIQPLDTPVVQAAETVRRSWGLDPHAPIEYLTHEIERSGVVVVVRRLLTSSSRRILGDSDSTGKLDKHLGYSVRVGEFNTRPLIIVRQSNSWERTRWTLAHEIGHLTLHASGNVTETCEEQASQFASELLAPAAMLAKEVPRSPSLAELLPVKAKWGLSLGALLKHLHTAELLSEPKFDALRRQLYTRANPETGTTWGRVEPGWDDREVERPRLISKWLEMAFSARSAAMLAPYGLPWPQDLLEDFLAGQRAAPQATVAPSMPDTLRPAARTFPAAVAQVGGNNVIAFSPRSRRG
ncbi:ImmA/IrrE family metallo-endopeptidase [Mycobacteroides abscessus]|uniref:ImmA/IrrE family metallo-endopeptidase n=1 Tax=Mycobacteroides abscessus TaxID=36809 RepID=UPI000C261091|nr:ImmA/IrrE family metallo-endopeptidase [Mycobacteroides abscessus]PVA74081.1 ImmA/IrrE family metallo-endopeptidase [Mycobacteroides abscessus]PVB11550.1 ImmA/IrrE family metallo-endopeptidase [Mycobacteroides abscessus]